MPPARAGHKGPRAHVSWSQGPPPQRPERPSPPLLQGPGTDLHLVLGRDHPLAKLLEPGLLTSVPGLLALQLPQLPLAFTQLCPYPLSLLLQLPDALAVLPVQGLGRLPWK